MFASEIQCLVPYNHALNFHTSVQSYPQLVSRRPEILQGAWGLVPGGVRVLLVEAESKFMELKYPGARTGGASDGASDLLGVSVLRADTHEV